MKTLKNIVAAGRYALRGDSRLARRELRFIVQRLIRGFDDTDLWSLDATIAHFALPRLRAFKESTCDMGPYKLIEEGDSWDRVLGEFIWACEQYESGAFYTLNREDRERHHEAMRLFGVYFSHLWW